MTFPEWTALSTGKTSPCVEPHSTVNETLSKVVSSLRTPAGSMVSKSLDSCVPPGMGKNRSLPKLARLQRMLNKRVATEYGLEFPYVPQDVMQVIEVNRELWYSEAVWDYLSVPKPF